MASEPQALAIARSEPPPEGDYGALCAALEASERGRTFLHEYARRNRAADTEMLLAAIDRLSAQIRGDAETVQHMRAELRTLLAAIRLARPDIEAGRPPDKVAMLGQLVDLLERRIEGLIGNRTADAEPVRPQLAVVPPSDEPELPIPSPAAQAPTIAVVPAPTKTATTAAIMPEVNVFEPGLPLAKAGAKAGAKPAAKAEPPNAERLRLLSPIMMLSEDERLALFS